MALKPLLVRITGDTTGLEKSVGRAGQSLKGLAVAAGAASTLVVGAIAAMAVQGLKAVDANVKLARSMDGTVNGLRAVQIAAGYSGVAIGDVNSSMQQLNRELARASEKGSPAADAIKALGMNAKELTALDADQRMAAIADRVQELGLNSSQTANILRDLGIRSRDMTLLFLQGGDAIRAARDEVSAFGLELSATQTAGIENANDALARMVLVFDSLRQKLAAEVAPVLQNIATRFTELAKSDSVQNAIERLVSAFGRLADVILSEDFIGTAVSGLQMLAETAAWVAEGMVTLSNNAEAVTIAMSALAVAVAALGGPLWLVGAALSAALVGLSKWPKAAGEAATASGLTKEAQDDLNKAMRTFAETGAPEAGAAAIALANDNYKLAESAFAAAEAELAKATALQASRLVDAPKWIKDAVGAGANIPEVDAASARLEAAAETLAAARAKLKQTANEITGSNYGGVSDPAPPGTPNDNTDTPEIIPGVGGAGAVADDMASRLEAIINGLMTERETVAAWYEEGLATLQEAKDRELLTEEEYRQQRERLEAEHTGRMSAIRKAERGGAMAGYKGMFGDLSSLMRSENEKLFKIGQAASIANATVSGLEAATEAWNKGMAIGGPGVAAAFTAASLVRTGALISQIASQSPNGGGGAGGGGSAGASAVPAAPAQAGTYYNVTLTGGDNARFSGSDVRRLMESIGDEIAGGSVIRGLSVNA